MYCYSKCPWPGCDDPVCEGGKPWEGKDEVYRPMYLGVHEEVKVCAEEMVQRIQADDIARAGADMLVSRRPVRLQAEFRRYALLPVVREGREVEFDDIVATPYGLYFLHACDSDLDERVERMCKGWVTAGDYDAMFLQLCDYMMHWCEADDDLARGERLYAEAAERRQAFE
jgi:hypothetical protein